MNTCQIQRQSDEERKRLFHFTCLWHLPDILREGISKGEVPTGPERDFTKRPNAVNLTLIGDRGSQQDWNGNNVFDKTKVRLEVEWPDAGLKSFCDMVREYNVSPQWVDEIDPWKQRDKWFFVFGTITASQIREVCIFDGAVRNYVPVVGEDLTELVRQIEGETRDKLPRIRMPNGIVAFRLDDKNSNCWLLDGPRYKQTQKAKRRQNRRQETERRRQQQLERKGKK